MLEHWALKPSECSASPPVADTRGGRHTMPLSVLQQLAVAVDAGTYLKISLGTPPGPKVAKVGPRTLSRQTSYCKLGPKLFNNGVHFEASIGPKIVLVPGVKKVGHLEGPRVAKLNLPDLKHQ